MAYTCSKCGWKHKPSQEKYYKSRGLTKPKCIDCNPSRSQKFTKIRKELLVGFFSNSYFGRGPLACIPYLPVVFFLSFVVTYISPEKIATFLGCVFFLVGYVFNSYIATEVGDKIRQRFIYNKPITSIVIGYYLPLALIVIGTIIFLTIKSVR